MPNIGKVAQNKLRNMLIPMAFNTKELSACLLIDTRDFLKIR